MKTKQTGIFLILAISIATVISGTAALNLATPAFANDDGQKCKKNDNNNCNHNENEQKTYGKNYCEISNVNKDHSDHNTNDNDLDCINSLANVDDSLLESALDEAED